MFNGYKDDLSQSQLSEEQVLQYLYSPACAAPVSEAFNK